MNLQMTTKECILYPPGKDADEATYEQWHAEGKFQNYFRATLLDAANGKQKAIESSLFRRADPEARKMAFAAVMRVAQESMERYLSEHLTTAEPAPWDT